MKTDSQASNLHIYVFISPCARVFFPKKTKKKWVQFEILMREARSQQAKHVILTHHSMQIKHLLTEPIGYICVIVSSCLWVLFPEKTQEK
jgi:hypothetical protein